MNLADLLDALFPAGHRVRLSGDMLTGSGRAAAGEVAVMGTANRAYVGVEIALALARFVLDQIRDHPGRPFLMLVDTQGQRLSRRDELLGINGYFAHLAKCLELARTRGHRLVTLVYGEGVSGGFLCFGLMADEIHALADAKIRVMNLPAMSRVTKIEKGRLEELSQSSPVFAPGVDNYVRMGGVHSVWDSNLAARLEQAISSQPGPDSRRALGAERQGRVVAERVARLVREAAND